MKKSSMVYILTLILFLSATPIVGANVTVETSKSEFGSPNTIFSSDDASVYFNAYVCCAGFGDTDIKWFMPNGSEYKGCLLNNSINLSINAVIECRYIKYNFSQNGVVTALSQRMDIQGMNRMPGKWHVDFEWYQSPFNYGNASVNFTISSSTPSFPTIMISTDKYSYKPGNRMIVSLNLTNPGAITTVRESIWMDKPDGRKHMVLDNPSLSLSEGFNSSKKFPITLPNIPAGNYAWHAVLKNSKGEILSESIAPWSVIGTRNKVESFGTVLNNLINIE